MGNMTHGDCSYCPYNEGMTPIEYTTKTEVPDQFLADLIITAVEGGTGYWAQVSDYHWDDPDPNSTYAVLHEIDAQTGQPGEGKRLTTTRVAYGLSLLAGVQSWRFAQLTDPENEWDHDAEDADVVAQLALLGNIVYG